MKDFACVTISSPQIRRDLQKHLKTWAGETVFLIILQKNTQPFSETGHWSVPCFSILDDTAKNYISKCEKNDEVSKIQIICC